MKKILSQIVFLLAFVLFSLGGSLKVFAADGTVTLHKGSTIETVKITNGRVTEGDIKDKANITSVKIEGSISEIGDRAFYGCTKLQSVAIPSTVKKIGASAFYGCTSLTTISIPYGVETVGGFCFAGCSKLQEISIPGSVKSIEKCLFQNCVLLSKLTLINGVDKIGAQAFEGCVALSNITIPQSVTSIDGSAFDGCSGLWTYTVHEANSKFCSTKDGLLYSKDMTILEKCPVKKSGSYVIPNSVVRLSDNAFKDCASLAEVVIPAETKVIGAKAFSGCTKLKTVTNLAPTPQPIQSTTFSTYGTLNVSKGSLDAYKKASSWSSFSMRESAFVIATMSDGSVVVRDYVDGVFPNNAFQGNKNIASVTLGEGIKQIADGAFRGCSALESVKMPASVNIIGGNAFRDCSALMSVNLPYGVSSIGNWAFSGCTSLATLTIPASLQTISASTFEGCTKLANLEILNGVKYIGKAAFKGCSALSEIRIPRSVENINETAFEDCSGLYNINVDEGNKWYCTVDGVLFAKDMTTLYKCPTKRKGGYSIPVGVMSIATSSFQDCKELTSVIIPNGVLKIGDSAFSGCTSLESVVISATVESIGEKAFAGCVNLKNVTNLAQTPQIISTNTFPAVDILRNVDLYVPSGCRSAYLDNYDWRQFKEIWESPVVILTYVDGTTKVVTEHKDGVIPERKYAANQTLASVVVGEGFTKIGNSAFRGCASLKSVEFPSSLTQIDDLAFEGCTALQAAKIPYLEKGETKLGSMAFKNCSSITELVVPSNLKKISANAFEGCSKLSKITFVAGVETIDKEAFKGCVALSLIDIPQSVKMIHESAFLDCSGLYEFNVDVNNAEYSSVGGVLFTHDKKVLVQCPAKKEGGYTIPSTVQRVGEYAFKGCEQLTSMTIPAETKTIGGYSFNGCKKMLVVTNLATTPQTIKAETFTKYDTLHVSKGLLRVYKSAEYWGKFTTVKDDPFVVYTTTEGNTEVELFYDGILPNDKLQGKTNVVSVVVGEGMSKISDSALRGCSALKSVTLPSTLTSIGATSFRDCSALSKINIPNGVESIGNMAFYNCTSLEEITIPSTVKTVGASAFEGCTTLAKVDFVDGVQSIGMSAFKGCSKITSISIPRSVVSLDETAFEGCTGITAFNVNNDNPKYTSSEDILFNKDMTVLIQCPTKKTGEYLIPYSVLRLAKFAFAGCSGLKSVTIQGNVATIGEYAFNGCKLDDVKNLRTTPQKIVKTTFTYYNKLHVPSGCRDVYYSDPIWKQFSIRDDGNSIMPMVKLAMFNGTTETVEFSNGAIPAKAFADNSRVSDHTKIVGVEICEGITSIGAGAFSGCTAIRNVTNWVMKPQAISAGTFESSVMKDQSILHVPTEAMEAYKSANEWKNWRTIVPEAVYNNDKNQPVMHLMDGYSFSSYSNMNYAEVDYTKKFSATDTWEAFSAPLPVNVSYSAGFDMAEIYAVAPCTDTNNDGKIDDKDDKCVIVKKMAAGSTTVPNTPYVIRSHASDALTLPSNDRRFHPEKTRPIVIDVVSETYSFDVVMENTPISVNNKYIVDSNSLRNVKTNVAPTRWILTVTKSGNVPTSIRLYTLDEDIIETNVNGERRFFLMDDADAMNILRETQQSQDIYTLDGRKVSGNTSLKGIYIKGGRKVLLGK